MITSVHSVLIGKQAPAFYTTVDVLAVGDVALFDENKALIKTAADAVMLTLCMQVQQVKR